MLLSQLLLLLLLLRPCHRCREIANVIVYAHFLWTSVGLWMWSLPPRSGPSVMLYCELVVMLWLLRCRHDACAVGEVRGTHVDDSGLEQYAGGGVLWLLWHCQYIQVLACCTVCVYMQVSTINVLPSCINTTFCDVLAVYMYININIYIYANRSLSNENWIIKINTLELCKYNSYWQQ